MPAQETALPLSRPIASTGPARPSNRSRTVTVYDDDPDLLLIYEVMLRPRYQIVTASSGEECVQKYAQMTRSGMRIAGIMLDYRLGDATGDEVALEIKGVGSTPIILTGAFDIESTLIDRLRSKGYIATFVRKPVGMQRLNVILERHFAS